MNRSQFPDLIQSLPEFDGPFDAFRLAADNCEVLFASYPAGTSIDTHTHPSRNAGVITVGELILTRDGRDERYGIGEWYRLEPNEPHAARFEVATSEIEFWFEA